MVSRKVESDCNSLVFKQLAESVPVLFYAVDRQLCYTYINSFFSKTHSISQSDAIGLSIADVIGREAFEANLVHYHKVLAGEAVRYDSHFIKKDGDSHYYHAIYEPLCIEGVIKGFTGVVVDTAAEKELERISNTDVLTGLYNRRKFEADLADILASSAMQLWGLMILDIDHFKNVNDNYGHDVGDLALQNIAAEIGRICGSDCRVYRVGGEEYALICQLVDSGEYKRFVEQLRTEIAAASIIHQQILTVSIGATVFLPGECRESLLKRVDLALYKCKEVGRNSALLV
ncbi:sensor domain-containing diguanylate cyclase [Aliamphritea ceti]|uniref:sensor domain-containing diguanylate cyclase n=1 Tax=Aliamphritea ceti TaxID=1524258 RepID=UPI0021C336B7|nr:sensor domain-containing diguanylate cyclase [Aliamphritea ceti]